jgi:outer membrane protein assembly factor BamA
MQLKQRVYPSSVEAAAAEAEEIAREAWQDRGYFQAQVRSDARVLTSSPTSQRMALTLQIDEGHIYRLAGISFRNNRAISNSKALRSLFAVKDGDLFDKAAVVKGLEAELFFFSSPMARLPAGVSPSSRIRLKFNEKAGTVAITFDIRPCPSESASDHSLE